MSILDELFDVAAANIEPSYTQEIWASITINPRSPFPAEAIPGNIGLGWGRLAYTPRGEVEWGGLRIPTPASFSSQSPYIPGFGIAVDGYAENAPPSSTPENIILTISEGSSTLSGATSYNVSITFPGAKAVSFAAQADPVTNVIYGPLGNAFIVISLSSPQEVGTAQ